MTAPGRAAFHILLEILSLLLLRRCCGKGKREALVFGIYLQNPYLDRLAFGEHVAGMVDALALAELGNMDKPVHARRKRHKSAKRRKARYSAGVAGFFRKLAVQLHPGIGQQCLQAEGEFIFLPVKIHNFHLDLLPRGKHAAEILNAAPAHFGNGQQALDAADIDKSAKGP